MNETVQEWLAKAQDDLRVAEREFSAELDPSYDASCFHAQQCVEKLMKAVLIDHEVLAPRTHDLVELSRLLQSVAKHWTWDEVELQKLNHAAVAYRYPGESANRKDAADAVRLCQSLYEALMNLLTEQP